MRKINIFWIIAMVLIVSNITYAVDKEVLDKKFNELNEDQKGQFYDELISKISDIMDSKAYEQKPEDAKGEVLDKIISTVEIQDSTKLADTLKSLDNIKGEYGILTEGKSIAGKYATYGASTALVIIILFFIIRRRMKNSKWIANTRLPHIIGREKKEIDKIAYLIENKKPLIEENNKTCQQVEEEIKVMKDVKETLSKEGHFMSFKKWDVLFNPKKLSKEEKALMETELKKKSPEVYTNFVQTQQKGLSTEKLLENNGKISKINDEIVDLIKGLMKFESRYDKAAKRLQIQLDGQETEMENFYKKFIVWKREEVIVDVEATKVKIDEQMKKIEAEKDEGAKRFADEAKKSIQIYHLKQQMVNALSGKVKISMFDGTPRQSVKEFAGEAANLEMEKKIVENMPAKLSKGKYDELRKDVISLIHCSARIKQLYERWELNVIKTLIGELSIHEKLSELDKERVKEIGGAKKLAKEVSKKAGLFSKEKDMDKILDDIKKYARTFGETRAGHVRNGEDLKRKIQFIIEEELKKKKYNAKVLDYLKEIINDFVRNEGMKIFSESVLLKGKHAEIRTLVEELVIIITRKIEYIKSTTKK